MLVLKYAYPFEVFCIKGVEFQPVPLLQPWMLLV